MNEVLLFDSRYFARRQKVKAPGSIQRHMWVLGLSSQGVKQPGRVVAYLLPPNANIRHKSFCNFVAYYTVMS